MILLDNEDEQKPKLDSFFSTTVRHPEPAVGRSLSSLPDYYASEAFHKELIKSPAPSPKKVSKNFWKAVVYAFFIYLALTFAIGGPLLVLKLQNSARQKDFDDNPNTLWVASDVSSLPPQLATAGNISMGENMTCNVWSSPGPSSSPSDDVKVYLATFKLPPAGLVSIRSNASMDIGTNVGSFRGNFSVDINTNPKIPDVVFNVEIQATGKELPAGTHVCFTDKGDNRGLTIFVPSDLPNPDDFLKVTVHIDIPHSSPSAIDNFITYLPAFSQTFGDLRKQAFNQFTIEGSGNDIDCKFLRAPQISVKNLLSSISGTFNVTRGLNLDTIKGAINADIMLAKATKQSQPTYLTLDTGFSEINATVTLISPSAATQTSSPSFVLQAKTFNAGVYLNVSHSASTPPMPLRLLVRNNVAPSFVSLDSKYQGNFVAQSKLANVTVHQSPENPSADPLGKNRKRTLQYDKNSPSSSSASGWIGWGDPNECKSPGYVEIVSSFSPVTLDI